MCELVLPAESGDAVDGDAAVGVGAEARLEQVEPVVHDVRRRRVSVVERPVLSKMSAT